MILVLTGGTGGAKLVQGLQQVVTPEDLTVIVNTGDDIEWWGLHVSPDLDSVLYALSGLLSADRGWGVDNDSFRCLERMKQFGQPSWFSLGDLDLATHLTRTVMLRAGKSLSRATAELAAKLGIRARVLPMSDDGVATVLDTPHGTLTFQEYFVRERHQIAVRRRPPRTSGAGRGREHRSGRGDHLRSQQSGDEYRAHSVGAGNSRCLAADQGPGCCGEPDRWWSGGLRTGGRTDEDDGLAEHDCGSCQSL